MSQHETAWYHLSPQSFFAVTMHLAFTDTPAAGAAIVMSGREAQSVRRLRWCQCGR
jgi:hypothetical protein